MMKKLQILALALVLILTLGACGPATPNQPSEGSGDKTGTGTSGPEKRPELTLKIAEQLPTGHVMADCMEFYADKIEELSGGTIKVERYPGGQLGDDVSTIEGVQNGSIDICRVELSTLRNFGYEYGAVAALPYVIRDRDHFWKMVEDPLAQELLDGIQADGLKMVGVCFLEEGARHFFFKDPVNGIADLKGKKIRVQNTENMAGDNQGP